MKRSKFLAALATMFAVPFMSFGKKEPEIKSTQAVVKVNDQPLTWVFRESIIISEDRDYENQKRYAMQRIMKNLEDQVKVWETGAIGHDGKPRKVLNLFMEVVVHNPDQKVKAVQIREMLK